MKPTSRPYQAEDDYWRMREFLRQVFQLNGRLERSWHISRLDYARWHTCLNCAHVRLEDVAFLWETGGELVAFLMPDGGPGEAHLCVHPALRTRELDEEMLSVAEERLAAVTQDGSHRLYVWSPEQDTLRQGMLSRRGYTLGNGAEYQWRRPLDAPVPDVPLAQDYAIRSRGDGLELLERC